MSVSGLADKLELLYCTSASETLDKFYYDRVVLKRNITRNAYAKVIGHCSMLQNAMYLVKPTPTNSEAFAEGVYTVSTRKFLYKSTLEKDSDLVFQLTYDENENYTKIVIEYMDAVKNTCKDTDFAEIIHLPAYFTFDTDQLTPALKMYVLRATNGKLYELDSKFGKMYRKIIKQRYKVPRADEKDETTSFVTFLASLTEGYWACGKKRPLPEVHEDHPDDPTPINNSNVPGASGQ